MDHGDFIAAVASGSGMTTAEAERLNAALGAELTAIGERLGAVSIPRFGTFETIKEEERVDVDLSTGRKVLLPPRVVMNFKASAALRKTVE